MIIDAHAHAIPDQFPGRDGWPELRPAEDGRVLVTSSTQLPVTAPFFDPRARLEAMAAAGLDAEVISPLPQVLDFQAPALDYRDRCRHINEAMTKFCAADPRRLYGLGTVPLQDVDLAIAELRVIRKLGLYGAEIGSAVGPVLVGDPRYLPFFEAAATMDMPLLVHALPPVSYELPAASVPSFGMPAQSGLGAASIISGPVPAACPRLRLAFTHGGGGLPSALPRAHYFWGGSRNGEPPVRETAGTPSPLEIARRYYFDTLTFDRRMLAYAIDLLGAGQFVVGSDFPATPREEPATGTLSSIGLTSAQFADVAWYNAFRFLGIPQ